MQGYARLPSLTDEDRLLKNLLDGLLDNNEDCWESTYDLMIGDDYKSELDKITEHMTVSRKFYRPLTAAKRRVASARLSMTMLTSINHTKKNKPKGVSFKEEGLPELDTKCFESSSEEMSDSDDEKQKPLITVDSDEGEVQRDNDLEKTISDLKKLSVKFSKVAPTHKDRANHRSIRRRVFEAI